MNGVVDNSHGLSLPASLLPAHYIWPKRYWTGVEETINERKKNQLLCSGC